jgi:hypothetical protein
MCEKWHHGMINTFGNTFGFMSPLFQQFPTLSLMIALTESTMVDGIRETIACN